MPILKGALSQQKQQQEEDTSTITFAFLTGADNVTNPVIHIDNNYVDDGFNNNNGRMTEPRMETAIEDGMMEEESSPSENNINDNDIIDLTIDSDSDSDNNNNDTISYLTPDISFLAKEIDLTQDDGDDDDNNNDNFSSLKTSLTAPNAVDFEIISNHDESMNFDFDESEMEMLFNLSKEKKKNENLVGSGKSTIGDLVEAARKLDNNETNPATAYEHRFPSSSRKRTIAEACNDDSSEKIYRLKTKEPKTTITRAAFTAVATSTSTTNSSSIIYQTPIPTTMYNFREEGKKEDEKIRAEKNPRELFAAASESSTTSRFASLSSIVTPMATIKTPNIRQKIDIKEGGGIKKSRSSAFVATPTKTTPVINRFSTAATTLFGTTTTTSAETSANSNSHQKLRIDIKEGEEMMKNTSAAGAATTVSEAYNMTNIYQRKTPPPVATTTTAAASANSNGYQKLTIHTKEEAKEEETTKNTSAGVATTVAKTYSMTNIYQPSPVATTTTATSVNNNGYLKLITDIKEEEEEITKNASAAGVATENYNMANIYQRKTPPSASATTTVASSNSNGYQKLVIDEEEETTKNASAVGAATTVAENYNMINIYQQKTPPRVATTNNSTDSSLNQNPSNIVTPATSFHSHKIRLNFQRAFSFDELSDDEHSQKKMRIEETQNVMTSDDEDDEVQVVAVKPAPPPVAATAVARKETNVEGYHDPLHLLPSSFSDDTHPSTTNNTQDNDLIGYSQQQQQAFDPIQRFPDIGSIYPSRSQWPLPRNPAFGVARLPLRSLSPISLSFLSLLPPSPPRRRISPLRFAREIMSPPPPPRRIQAPLPFIAPPLPFDPTPPPPFAAPPPFANENRGRKRRRKKNDEEKVEELKSMEKGKSLRKPSGFDSINMHFKLTAKEKDAVLQFLCSNISSIGPKGQGRRACTKTWLNKWRVAYTKKYPRTQKMALWEMISSLSDEISSSFSNIMMPKGHNNGNENDNNDNDERKPAASIGPLNGVALDALQKYFNAHIHGSKHAGMLQQIRPYSPPPSPAAADITPLKTDNKRDIAEQENDDNNNGNNKNGTTNTSSIPLLTNVGDIALIESDTNKKSDSTVTNPSLSNPSSKIVDDSAITDSTANKGDISTAAIDNNDTVVAPAAALLTCCTCYDEFELQNTVPCGGDKEVHFFCKPCFHSYVTITVESGPIQAIPCPIPKCNSFFSTDDAKHNLSDWDILKIQDRENRRNERVALAGTAVLHCICGVVGVVSTDEDVGDGQISCPSCSRSYCCHCGNDAHGTDPCPPPAETVKWLDENTKECPNCHNKIQKDGGCDHMTCRLPMGCGHEFWWTCGCPYRQGHRPNCRRLGERI